MPAAGSAGGRAEETADADHPVGGGEVGRLLLLLRHLGRLAAASAAHRHVLAQRIETAPTAGPELSALTSPGDTVPTPSASFLDPSLAAPAPAVVGVTSNCR
jgi:hypothetical protein